MVRLHGVGEPTLHPEFGRILSIVRSHGLIERSWLFTCGVVAAELLPALAESLGIIEISLNAVTPEGYWRTKGRHGFEAVVRNSESLREEAARRGLPLRVLISRVASDDEEDQRFLCHWRGRGFESLVRSYHSYGGILQARGTAAAQESLPKCLVAWRRLNLDGTLSGARLTAVNCFNVLFQHPSQIPPAAILGAYPDESLTVLWHNSSFVDLRRSLLRGAPTGTCCDVCRECLTDEGQRSDGIVTGENWLC